MPALNYLSVSTLPAVYFDGEWRVLGMIPSDPLSWDGAPTFGQTFAAAIDPATWREIDLSFFNLPVKNQGSTNSCVGHAASSGAELSWAQSGRDKVNFSAYFIYGLINGGRDQGAMISNAMSAMMQTGVARTETVPPGLMFREQFPQAAFESAAKHKMIKAFQCRTFDEICSAITIGFPVSLGIYVGSNFPQLDAEGVAPLPVGRGGGHAILGLGLKKSSRYGWLIKILNSWGANYGNNGYAYLRKEHFQYMNPDAFAIQAMGGDDPQTPVVNN